MATSSRRPQSKSVMAMLALVTMAGCARVGTLADDDHIVAAPISARANTVLENLVQAGVVDDVWSDEMSAGCATIWATQFGLRAGQRRDREDLVRLGTLTADLEAAALRSMLWDAATGDIDPNDPAVPGYPGLFVAAAMRGDHAKLFGLTIGPFVDKAKGMNLGARENAGLATLLAEVHRAHPERPRERLEDAREFAERIAETGRIAYHALAWASIARAGGDPADITRAREMVRRATPEFRDDGNIVLPESENYPDVLSMHLAVVHAMTDLAQVDPESGARGPAVALLDYVFSDYYFDGAHIMHDRGFGLRAETFCSGCNFFALYLADRLYGDTLVLAPIAEPPRLAAPEPRWQEIAEHRWQVAPAPEFKVETRTAGLSIEYRFRHDMKRSLIIELAIDGTELGAAGVPLVEGVRSNTRREAESGGRRLTVSVGVTPISFDPLVCDVEARVEELTAR